MLFWYLLTKSCHHDAMPKQAPISHHLDLFDYWLAKRGHRTMPSRRDVDPGDIPMLLSCLMIVERAADQFRYRLVGTTIVQEVGHDATGSLVGSYLTAPKAAAEARAIFARVFTEGVPVFATGEISVKSGSNLLMSMLLLPLSDDGMTVNMTIASFVARFNPGLTASRDWLRGLPIKVSNVTGVASGKDLRKLCLEWGAAPCDRT